MKKIYSLLFVCLAALAQAQTAIPNGNFEQWSSGTYDIPQYYLQSSNPSSFFRENVPFNCTKTTDAYSGTYALQLTTDVGTDTAMAYLINASGGQGDPCTFQGGIPYTETPTGIQGYFKSNIMPGDSAGILVVFKSGGACLGYYMYKFGGVNATYTPFNFTFSPALASAPDTVIFAAVSSDVFNDIQIPGSTIQLDNITFAGVATQPAQFNGDFETWQSVTLDKPDSWYIETSDEGLGVAKTTDAYAGTNAIELTTRLGDQNGQPIARNSSISTGYYECNGGPCTQKGGYPFGNMIDTLAFYYKYAPMNNDSAHVNLRFKSGGSEIYNTGMPIHAAASYTYMELPFNTNPSTPDSVIIEFQSSNWNDTALAFIGSVLIIDEIQFKTQPLATGIKFSVKVDNGISIYPNPSASGLFMINQSVAKDAIHVYNILGEEVNVMIDSQKERTSVRVPSDTQGIYFIQINSGGKRITEKIIVGK